MEVSSESFMLPRADYINMTLNNFIKSGDRYITVYDIDMACGFFDKTKFHMTDA